ncbi:Nuclear hormone receptor family member nhr-71 [Aphelenchoides bicaudatus]|nr:Nuclear hormone receptor family member nhr-71 [Aphelenchoides bicaudatus]
MDNGDLLPDDIPTSSQAITSRRQTLVIDANVRCAVCDAEADGVHYGAISCRSCTAFFRRSVTYKQKYACRNNDNCPINQHDRCVCRACRLNACFRAGMTIEAVRPQREPTGTQKRRNTIKRKLSKSSIDSLQMKQSPAYTEMDAPEMSPQIDELSEFERLVDLYVEHLKIMNRSLVTTEEFLNEMVEGKSFNLDTLHYLCLGPKLIQMLPQDVDRLATIELGGLSYWIEKLEPFTKLPTNDRVALFKRYSVRKLSLDHFYVASKHPQHVQAGNFVMNNNRFVPSYLTGFETPEDTELTRKAKFRLLRPTIDQCLTSVIRPFYELEINDAEIVTLHHLLMFSSLNQEHVSKETCLIMQERRSWIINRLYEYYVRRGYIDAEVRLGEILLQLCEIEIVCDKNCKDVQVLQLFKSGKLEQYWYDRICYDNINF